MTKWKTLVEKVVESRERFDGSYDFVFNLGADNAKITEKTAEIGLVPTDEFYNLYSSYDGIGCCPKGRVEEPSWWVVPLDHLSKFIESTRIIFEENEGVGNRFFPFIDYSSGEGLGFFQGIDGQVLPGLFEFELGSYDFDEEQDPAEYMRSVCATIEEYFLGRIYQE